MQRLSAALVFTRPAPGASRTAVQARIFTRFSTAALLSRLRALGASPDAFVYAAAVFILHEIELPVPYFRGSASGGSGPSSLLPRDPSTWTIEQVVSWVSGQSFRSYRQAFRSELVNGRMLLELTDEDCAEALGMQSRLHRRATLLAIEDLRSQYESCNESGAAGAPLTSRSRSQLVPMAAEAPLFDCFISYRRAGGADFAQLLKV